MFLDTIYIDMDGVLFDYYRWLNETPERYSLSFRELVFDHQIFSQLLAMPFRNKMLDVLKNYQFEFPQVQLKILSSAGSYHDDIYEEVCRQKNNALDDHGILYERIFTHCGESKSKYANPRTLLIDDNANNCINFRWNEGNAYDWKKADLTQVTSLQWYLDEHFSISSLAESEC